MKKKKERIKTNRGRKVKERKKDERKIKKELWKRENKIQRQRSKKKRLTQTWKKEKNGRINCGEEETGCTVSKEERMKQTNKGKKKERSMEKWMKMENEK